MPPADEGTPAGGDVSAARTNGSSEYRPSHVGELDREVGLYRRLLGDDWELLPLPVRQFHGDGTAARSRGAFRVAPRRSPGSWLVGQIMRLPASGAEVPLDLEV